MVAVLQIFPVMGNGRIHDDATHPTFKRIILAVTLDVLENLDKAVLQHILCVFSRVGMANGCCKKLSTEARIKIPLGSGFLFFTRFNQCYELLGGRHYLMNE